MAEAAILTGKLDSFVLLLQEWFSSPGEQMQVCFTLSKPALCARAAPRPAGSRSRAYTKEKKALNQ